MKLQYIFGFGNFEVVVIILTSLALANPRMPIPAKDTRHSIVTTYVDFCREGQPDGFLCDWETAFNSGAAPTCPANMRYEGQNENIDSITYKKIELKQKLFEF